jgi:hypothetical protein
MLKSNGRNWQWLNSKTPSRRLRWGKGWVFQFHWSWLSSYLISEWNFLNVSLGIRILILNSIGEKNHSRFSLVHEGWASHWLKGFPNFHWTRKTSSWKGHGRLTKRGVISCVFFSGKKGGECVWEKINYYVWKKIIHGKKLCKKRAWKEVVCSK